MSKENESRALVVYDELGAPIAYILHQQDELSKEQMEAIMKTFSGTDNAETLIRWSEEA